MGSHERNVLGRRFGKHIQSLRCARGFTQEMLAEASDLSPDTIRRLESRSHCFAPSLLTISKLCKGLGISMGTLFMAFDMRDAHRRAEEVVDSIDFLAEDEVEALLRFFLLLKRRGSGDAA